MCAKLGKMPNQKLTSFSYYFLNKRLHPAPLPGFRASIILLIVNQNKGDNFGKFLFIRQTARGYMSWNLPQEGMETTITADDVFTTIARGIEEELGFRGLKIPETKPQFTQKALIFDFARQKYDQTRSAYEKTIDRPSKGKIYHLAMMDYHGPEEIPISSGPKDTEIDAYRWVDQAEAQALLETTKKTFFPASADFKITLLNRIIEIYKDLNSRLSDQSTLF